jgi:hypothetical protein
MMQGEGTQLPSAYGGSDQFQRAGQVVGSTYVGATHFMAMLDDVSFSFLFFYFLPCQEFRGCEESPLTREENVTFLQIEDLKSYFNEEARDIGIAEEEANGEAYSPGMFMLSGEKPRRKEDLLNVLPERHVVDRLIMRYFSAGSPSQRKKPACPLGKRYLRVLMATIDIIHRPTFGRQVSLRILAPRMHQRQISRSGLRDL